MYIDILSSPSSPNELKAIVNARTLYQSCTNEDHIEAEDVYPILSVVNDELGGWPILQGSSWNASRFDLLATLLKLREYSNSVLFDMGTSTDEKNSTEYDIEVNRSGTHRVQTQPRMMISLSLSSLDRVTWVLANVNTMLMSQRSPLLTGN